MLEVINKEYFRICEDCGIRKRITYTTYKNNIIFTRRLIKIGGGETLSKFIGDSYVDRMDKNITFKI